MKFSTGLYASLWRISNDISKFQTFLRYSLLKLGEENVSWRDDRGVGGPPELPLEFQVFGSIKVSKTEWIFSVCSHVPRMMIKTFNL